MNAFERHGINVLSPSSLNLWRASPGLWALRYVAKRKEEDNSGFWRGNAVEAGFVYYLRTGEMGRATTVAIQHFDDAAQGEVTDDIIADRELIGPMIGELQKWPAPSRLNSLQIKVEHWLDNVPIPVVGYLDFAFDGIDVDLKTTKACPTTPRAEHIRQVALYRAARGRKGGLLYVTGKKHAYFEIDDDAMERALGDLSADALSLQHFLRRCNNKRDVLQSLPIDWDHFRAPKDRVPLIEVLMAG